MDKPGYEETLRQLAARRLEAFVTAVPHPHLAITVHQASRGRTIGTIRLLPSEHARTTRTVVPVTKRTGSNPFEHMITLGRAANNDLVFDHPNVSKFHAYLRLDGARWTVSDARSLNGTFVDGVRLEEQAQPLRDGSLIRLGDGVECLFLEATSLYRHLRAG